MPTPLDELFEPRIGTPGINPNAPDPRPRREDPLSGFLARPGGRFLANLLAQSGYSTVPNSPLGAIGRAALASQEQGREAETGDLRNRLLRARIGLAEQGQPTNTNVQSQFITEDGKLGFLRRNGEFVITDVDVKDSFSIQTLEDGSKIGVSKSDPNQTVQVVTPQQARDAKIAGAQSDVQAEATTDLPTTVSKGQRLLGVLDQLEAHQGLPGAVGLKGASQLGGLLDTPVAGTPEADFVALVEQAGGAVFLEAFQDLKGGGHITEIEGQKAEQAVARIRNRDQSEAGYKQAIDDLREIIRNGMERKRKEAEGDFSPVTGRSAQERIDAL